MNDRQRLILLDSAAHDGLCIIETVEDDEEEP